MSSKKKNIPTSYLVVYRILCLDEELVTGVSTLDHEPCHEDLNELVYPELEEYVNFCTSNGEMPEQYYECSFNIYSLVKCDKCHTSIAQSSYDILYNDVVMNNIKEVVNDLGVQHAKEEC